MSNHHSRPDLDPILRGPSLFEVAMAGGGGRLEARIRERELRWRSENPELAERMQGCVGSRVRTREKRLRLNGDVLPQGSGGVVVNYTEQRLLVRMDYGEVLLMKAAWVEVEQEAKAMKVYYFGYSPGRGHGLMADDESPVRMSERRHMPRSLSEKELDTGYCPESSIQLQGAALLTQVDGWTVIAFWDRSGDGRLNSNSAFLAEGDHSFEQMCTLARERFPATWKRITDAFEVRLVRRTEVRADAG